MNLENRIAQLEKEVAELRETVQPKAINITINGKNNEETWKKFEQAIAELRETVQPESTKQLIDNQIAFLISAQKHCLEKNDHGSIAPISNSLMDAIFKGSSFLNYK